MARINVPGQIVRWTDDGEFVEGASNRTEFALCGPVGDDRVGGEAHNGVSTREPAKFELVAFRVRSVVFLICDGHEQKITAGFSTRRRIRSDQVEMTISSCFAPLKSTSF